MNEDIVTISFQNGHYEVYDHRRNETTTKVMGKNGKLKDLTAWNVCRTVERIMDSYEEEKQCKN